MHRGYHRAGRRPQHPMSFDEEPAEIPKVLEDQAAHHRVERRISKRQWLVQIVGDEAHLAVGRLPPRLRSIAVPAGRTRAGKGARQGACTTGRAGC